MSTNSISPTPQKRETISETKGSRTLHVFNPEHDLALAVGSGPYTPPAEVLRLRKEKSLLPALYAEKGDFILVRDIAAEACLAALPYFEEASRKDIRIIFPAQIPEIEKEIRRVMPWGWDHAIAASLKDFGLNEGFMPSQEEIEGIRNLSHRRTVIPFRKFLAELLNEEEVNLPSELHTEEEAEIFLKNNPLSYFKAPWSSSGRGIVVSDHITRKGLTEWWHGIIRRQGSVIAEPAWNRVFDFATEWEIKNGEPEFLGFSVFEASSRGKYHGNIEAPSGSLLGIIKEAAPSFSEETVKAQQAALKKLVAPGYEGFLGIDMLADAEGRINPCVELNLRMTMGHVALFKAK